MDGGAWKAAVHGVTEGRTRLSDFSFTFHFHALEKEMATHSSVLAWRSPGTGEPGGLPSMGSHRVGHDWSDLVAAAAALSSSFVFRFKVHLHRIVVLTLNLLQRPEPGSPTLLADFTNWATREDWFRDLNRFQMTMSVAIWKQYLFHNFLTLIAIREAFENKRTLEFSEYERVWSLDPCSNFMGKNNE